MNPPSSRRGLAPAILSLTVASCVAPPPEVAPESEVVTALGLPIEVTFRPESSSPDEPPPGLPAAANAHHLSHADALRRAIGASARLQAALAGVRVAQAAAEQARTLPNPMLDFVVRFGTHSPQLEGFLAQPLLALLQRPRKARAADDRLRAAAADALTVALDEADAVRGCYLEAQMLERTIATLRRRQQLTQRRVQLVDSRLRHGEGSAFERSVAVTAQLGIEEKIATATQRLRSLRLQLARRIGEPSSSAAWQLDAWETRATALESEAEWIRRALERRPELHSLRWQLAALGDERALAKWAKWQDIAVGASLQRAPNSVGGPSLTIPLPVFDRGETATNRVTAEQSALRHRTTEWIRRAIEQVRAALASIEARRTRLQRVEQGLVPAFEARLQRARAAERIGEGSTLATLNAEIELGETQATVVRLEYEVARALLRLQRATAGVRRGKK